MITCPACSSPVSEDQRFCAQCGTGLGLEESPTGTAPRPLVPRPDAPSPPRGSSTPRWTRASDPLARPGERFARGTGLGGRNLRSCRRLRDLGRSLAEIGILKCGSCGLRRHRPDRFGDLRHLL